MGKQNRLSQTARNSKDREKFDPIRIERESFGKIPDNRRIMLPAMVCDATEKGNLKNCEDAYYPVDELRR